jgi:hypothetical protein
MGKILLAKGRLEAFSNGVIAVIITTMVLERCHFIAEIHGAVVDLSSDCRPVDGRRPRRRCGHHSQIHAQ